MNARKLADALALHLSDCWDADAGMSVEHVQGTPLGRLVAAYTSFGVEGTDPLRWLALFAARRSLPCWQLYCDGTGPLDAVVAAHTWIQYGKRPANIAALATAAKPTFRGQPIVDCRACDTGSVAEAAGHLIRFLDSNDPLRAIYCLGAADTAFDQSPLNRRDHFRDWFLKYAIPISTERREMTENEQFALREYSVAEIALARESDGAYWNGGAESDPTRVAGNDG